MKTLSIIALLSTLTISAFGMDCARYKGRLYPADAQAQELAKVLKVKTCSGKTFKAVVKSKGLTIRTIKATPALIKSVNDRLNENRQKSVEAAAAQLSF